MTEKKIKDEEMVCVSMKLKEIKAKYEDPRRNSWDREDNEELAREELQRETAIEEILKVIGRGDFSVAECEAIFKAAQKRISISTPAKVTGRYQRNHSEEDGTEAGVMVEGR